MGVIANVITHGLMALDVYNQLTPSEVTSAIKNHPRAYLLGSSGPRFLTTYNMLPWQDRAVHQVTSYYATRVKTEHIDDFFNYAGSIIHNETEPTRRQVLIAYVAGHFLNWTLDSLTNPFIYYRSGPEGQNTRYWHARYESALDALMVVYVKRRNLKRLHVGRFVNVTAVEQGIIADFYRLALQEVYGIQTKKELISDAIDSLKKVVNTSFDPHNLKTPIVEAYEKKEKKPWEYSRFMVNSRFDINHDVLNLKRESWKNPADPKAVSNQSFVELYDDAIILGVYLMQELNQFLAGKRSSFSDLLRDRQYTSGREVGSKMEVFASIYEK